jgi:hypothetical protein
MHLIQILLPIYDNQGQPFPQDLYHSIGDELVARFSGLTAFTRAPAQGLWVPAGKEPRHDDIMVFEVMTAEIDELWWSRYRETLEKRLRQDSIVIRTHEIHLL